MLGRRLHGARGGLAREAPVRAGYQAVLAVLPVAHEEMRAELLPWSGRERPVDAVGEEARRCALVRPHLDHRLAADGPATLHGRGRGETKELRARVDVPLPADGGHGVATGKQEAVAGVRLRPHGRIGRRAVHQGDDAAAAAVGQLDDAAAVALCGVHRQHDGKIGGELDQPRRVARRQRQVADQGVRRVQRVDREVRGAVHLLVGAHGAEALSAGIGHARRDLEPRERHRTSFCGVHRRNRCQPFSFCRALMRASIGGWVENSARNPRELLMPDDWMFCGRSPASMRPRVANALIMLVGWPR